MIRRVWRVFASIITLAVIGLVALELIARLGLGLGDPPLSQNHPTIKYMLQPGRTYHRFGNEYRVNAYSMRSDAFPHEKTDPDELRIMVFGDSIINGGNLTDQHELATELLRDQLHRTSNRTVVIGNISAGSWGPPNQLAYLRQFGLFDADLVVLVLNAADMEDEPDHQLVAGFSSSHPSSTPPTALHEVWNRYLPRYVPPPQSRREEPPPLKTSTNQRPEYQQATLALRTFCEEITASGVPVVLALHPTRQAFEAGEQNATLEALALTDALANVELVDLLPAYLEAARGMDPYRDDLHPNAAGQRALADALRPVIEQRLGLIRVSDPSAP